MGKELFGTDGIRGIPGQYPLDDATLERVGLALGKHLREQSAHPKVLIGRDTRESGPHIAECIARGLLQPAPSLFRRGCSPLRESPGS